VGVGAFPTPISHNILTLCRMACFCWVCAHLASTRATVRSQHLSYRGLLSHTGNSDFKQSARASSWWSLLLLLILNPPASSTTKNPPLGKRDERSGQGERGKKDERSGGNCGGFFGRAGMALAQPILDKY